MRIWETSDFWLFKWSTSNDFPFALFSFFSIYLQSSLLSHSLSTWNRFETGKSALSLINEKWEELSATLSFPRLLASCCRVPSAENDVHSLFFICFPFRHVNNVWNQWKFLALASCSHSSNVVAIFLGCYASHHSARLSRALSSLESPRSFHDLRPVLWHRLFMPYDDCWKGNRSTQMSELRFAEVLEVAQNESRSKKKTK